MSKPTKKAERELRIEQLRILCVTQRWVMQLWEASYRSGTADLKIAVRDAMSFFDRAEASKTEWTAEDVRRLQQLRAIAKRATQ